MPLTHDARFTFDAQGRTSQRAAAMQARTEPLPCHPIPALVLAPKRSLPPPHPPEAGDSAARASDIALHVGSVCGRKNGCQINSLPILRCTLTARSCALAGRIDGGAGGTSMSAAPAHGCWLLRVSDSAVP